MHHRKGSEEHLHQEMGSLLFQNSYHSVYHMATTHIIICKFFLTESKLLQLINLPPGLTSVTRSKTYFLL